MTTAEFVYWFLLMVGGCMLVGLLATWWSDWASDRSMDKLIRGIDDVRRRTGGQL